LPNLYVLFSQGDLQAHLRFKSSLVYLPGSDHVLDSYPHRLENRYLSIAAAPLCVGSHQLSYLP